MDLVGVSGSLNGQRLAVPREILRVKSYDHSEKHLKIDLLEQVVRKLSSDEGAVMDAGFKINQVQQAGLKGYLLRLAKNFTARRNEPAPRKEKGRPPICAEWVRPLGRTYADNEIPASPPDQVISWQEDGRKNWADIWTNLLLPGVVPHPNNETLQVLAIYDPLYAQPWLLATALPTAPPDVKALYQARWPVEQWSGPGTVDSGKLGKKEMNMPRTRTPYSLEFRQQILELVRTGRTPNELAREFEPSRETIRQWVKTS